MIQIVTQTDQEIKRDWERDQEREFWRFKGRKRSQRRGRTLANSTARGWIQLLTWADCAQCVDNEKKWFEEDFTGDPAWPAKKRILSENENQIWANITFEPNMNLWATKKKNKLLSLSLCQFVNFQGRPAQRLPTAPARVPPREVFVDLRQGLGLSTQRRVS